MQFTTEFIARDSAGNNRMTLNSSGNVTFQGTGTFNSDIRIKKNIFTIENALEKTLKLRGVEYDRIDNGDHQLGLIAQEVELVVPDLVYELDAPSEGSIDYGKESMKSVAYQNLTALLIEAIKEQQKQIEDLKTDIENLKGRLK
jgi:hypothetical protein